MYVTEICKRSQRRKQNCTAILRLRDFIAGLPPLDKSAAPLYDERRNRISGVLGRSRLRESGTALLTLTPDLDNASGGKAKNPIAPAAFPRGRFFVRTPRSGFLPFPGAARGAYSNSISICER